MKKDFESEIFKTWKETDVRMLSPLKLAYIGDAVYEVLVRSYLLQSFPGSMHKIHKEATKFVKAESQASIFYLLEPQLTDEEITIVKRGRNAKSGTVPKNAKLQDYKYATGFEALIGFLFLLNRRDRIEEFFSYIIESGVVK